LTGPETKPRGNQNAQTAILKNKSNSNQADLELLKDMTTRDLKDTRREIMQSHVTKQSKIIESTRADRPVQKRQAKIQLNISS